MKRFGAIVVTFALAGSVVVAMATGAGAALSEKDFKKQGNAVCKAGNVALEAVYEEHFGDLTENEQPDAAAIEAFVPDFVANIRGQVDELRDLDAPKSLAKKVDAFLAEAERALDEIEADPAVLADEQSDPFLKTSKLAKKAGLKTCAN